VAARSGTSAPRRKRAASGASGRSSRFGKHGSTEPRVYTPPLRPLEPRSPQTEACTLGYDVIDFAHDVLGVTLYPWQQWLLVHMLELLPDGSLRFRNVVVLVARQNGKSTLSQVLALWFMIVWGWPLVLGTAQDLDVAEEIWQGAVDYLEEDDELSALVKRVVKVNGKKSLELKSGSRYKVKAASRRAGRGLSGNLVLLDELREHQSWDAWGAITKTTMARAEALVVALSNAGDITSVVLRYLRRMAHQALGDPDGICRDEESAGGPAAFDIEGMDLVGAEDEDDPDADYEDWDDDELDAEDLEADADTLGLFEWSAPPGCDRWDRDGWSWSNPSRGYSITDRTIASAARTDPEWVFRTEVLCQWSDGTAEGPFPPGSWEAGQNQPGEGPDGKPVVRLEDRLVGNVVACVDQSVDRSHTFIAFAGYRADGIAQAEVVAGRHGEEWVADWLMEHRARVKRVTGQSRGADVSPLLAALDGSARFTIPVVEMAGAGLLEVFATAFDAVRDETVRHHVQPVLDIAARTAATNTLSGGAKLLDRRNSPSDVAPLMAWCGALWLLLRHRPDPPPPPPPPKALTPQVEDAVDTSDLATAGF
jgi:hypothetical protein